MWKPILCVDFDGVVHSYVTKWTDAVTIPDPPVKGALEWLWKASQVFQVTIYSSRSKTEDGIQAMRLWFARHCAKEFNMVHPMNNSPFPIEFAHKKPPAFLTIDDRAIMFNGDWSKLDPAAMRDFKPWYQRRNPNDPSER